MIRKLITTTLLLASASTLADSISDFQSSWTGQAMQLQRDLDVYSPMSNNNFLGSHNSYNSQVYRDLDSYLDPQQKHSIEDQLRLGARFIELDAHWTYKIDGLNWGNDLLLCHSGIGVDIGDVHLGCSLSDRRLAEGLAEISHWLNQDSNAGEVIILYIEDHTDGQYQRLYQVINDSIGAKIYASHGCHAIPGTLTKADVLSAGKQVVLWKDGDCANDSNLANLAFNSLGQLSRVWEDATAIAALSNFFTSSDPNHLNAQDIRAAQSSGINIVNLDNLTHQDDRLAASVWSWDVNEPNNYNGDQDCAVQWGNGRWDDANCNQVFAFACYQADANVWQVTGSGNWQQGHAACASLGQGYQFSVPTNSVANQQLIAAKGAQSHVWLNFSDQLSEGQWITSAPSQYANLEHAFGSNLKLAALYDQSLCMDVDGANAVANGTNVQTWQCDGVTETWTLLKSGKIQAAWNPNLCLDVDGTNSSENGTNIGIWQCDQVSETWKLLADGKIQARWNSNLCIDVFGHNVTDNGANIGLWQCDQVSERWTASRP